MSDEKLLLAERARQRSVSAEARALVQGLLARELSIEPESRA